MKMIVSCGDGMATRTGAGYPAGCPNGPSGAEDDQFKEVVLGKEDTATPFTMFVGTDKPLVVGNALTLHEGTIVLGAGAVRTTWAYLQMPFLSG
jgi:hypothetical protein